MDEDLKNNFSNVKLKWVKNEKESLIIKGNTAIEITKFTIEVTPISGGDPFISNGRAMIVYVRNSQAPHGWASIREVIQSATE